VRFPAQSYRSEHPQQVMGHGSLDLLGVMELQLLRFLSRNNCFFFEFSLVGTTRENRKSRKKFDKTRWSNASDSRPHAGMASPRVNTKPPICVRTYGPSQIVGKKS